MSNKIEVGSEVMYNDSKTVVTGKKGAMFTVRDWEHPIHESYLTLVSKAPESDLRYENLKGTKTLLVISTAEELRTIIDITGYVWAHVGLLKTDSIVINLNGDNGAGSYDTKTFYDDRSEYDEYNRIPASQFIAANSHESDKGEVKTPEQIWDMALTVCNNICVQISDRYNDDDQIEKADAATECAKQIRVGIGQYQPAINSQSPINNKGNEVHS